MHYDAQGDVPTPNPGSRNAPAAARSDAEGNDPRPDIRQELAVYRTAMPVETNQAVHHLVGKTQQVNVEMLRHMFWRIKANMNVFRRLLKKLEQGMMVV